MEKFLAVKLFETFFIDWFSVTRYSIYFTHFQASRKKNWKKVLPRNEYSRDKFENGFGRFDLQKIASLQTILLIRVGVSPLYAFNVLKQQQPTQILSFKTQTDRQTDRYLHSRTRNKNFSYSMAAMCFTHYWLFSKVRIQSCGFCIFSLSIEKFLFFPNFFYLFKTYESYLTLFSFV